jgi:hypothetical protein
LQKGDIVMRGPLQLVSIAALACGGCFIGAGSETPPPIGSPDARPPADASPPDAVPAAVCRNAEGTTLDGHHHPGLDCMAGNCHGPGGSGEAPAFTLAGTIYKQAAGTDPLPYASITIVDAMGTKLDITTTLNGNFYTSQTLVAPLKVHASKCPDLVPMVAQVQFGSCNACHTAGKDGPIHLP